MQIDYTLLRLAIINKKGDLLVIKEDNEDWILELWNKNKAGMTREYTRLIETYLISQEINISTILEFLPSEPKIEIKSDIPAVKYILKEMGLCQ